MSRIMAPPLSAAINEFLQWLELDRHASAGTVAEYRADMKPFAKYANKHGFDDAPVSDLDRDSPWLAAGLRLAMDRRSEAPRPPSDGRTRTRSPHDLPLRLPRR